LHLKKSLGANTIALPLPAWVICSYDEAGKPNAMTAAWTGICCSVPPCVYFAVRPSRYTYACVKARQAFTVNIPGVAQAEAVDYFGCVSGRKVDKLATAGLTASPGRHVDAPYIAEFPLVLECKVVQALELGTHVMFIGEIVDAGCDEELLGADGKPDAAKIKPIIYSTADSTYYAVAGAVGRAYALGKHLAE
jgi:flavin reductase (DIM6/NTAB) family NADH-FMN oxidoreductase RutF